MRRAALLMAVMLLGLAGCAVQPPAPDAVGDWQAINAWQAPAAPAHWRLEGRVSLRIDNRAATAGIRWRETGSGYRIDLRGALGAGRLRVLGTGAGVTLITADGKRHEADSPAELVRAVTGYELPVAFLRWWVVGQPVPWLPGRVRADNAGRASQLEQAGWQIRYGDGVVADGYPLPGRIEVRRDGVAVRVAVRDWISLPE